MPSRELRVHPAAILEVEEARLWYARIDPELGERFTVEVNLVALAALETPTLWAADGKGRRMSRLHVFPHAVVYEWVDPVVHILAVAHPSRRPGYWDRRS